MLISIFRNGPFRTLSLAAGVVASLLSAPVLAAAAPLAQPHISLELIAQGEAAAGKPTYVALREVMEPHWHTYWVNVGDVGQPTKITWTLPKGWAAGPIEWPAPQRLPYPPFMNYGYEGTAVLPVKIIPPASARPGQTAALKAHIDYQVCSDVCVPGQADLALDIKVAAGAPVADPANGPAIAAALDKKPKPATFQAAYTVGADGLKLTAAGDPLKGADVSKAYFFPYDDPVLKYPAPQAIERGPSGLTLSLTPAANRKPGPIRGVLSLGDTAYELTASEGPPVPGAGGLGALPSAPAGDGKTPAATPAPAPKGDIVTLAIKMLAAIGGGLILNLMPCVFPILSMKAASLAGHVYETKAARRQGLAFMAGCLATFLTLAAVLLAARAAGSAVGWGFQLQSPPVVAGLAILMLLVALDLSGVFEIGTSMQGAGSGLASKSGLVGAFFTGALAVVVAAPCTAPLMGPALAYALGQPPLTALLVFAALGVGFAAPFTALAFAPALLKLIPRPGAWMNIFKSVLAFPMYGAAIWLAWVFNGQAGHLAMGILMVAGLITAFGAWLFGQGQKQFSVSWRFALQAALPVALIIAAVLITPVARTEASSPAGEPSKLGSISREAWSPEKVASLQAQGRVVFVDFTADWCATCKVNEVTSLHSASVAAAFAQANAAYLVGDWTNHDAAIAKVLAEHDTLGVPLYLVYPAKGGEPEKLPQLLTEGIVKTALKRASGRA